MARESFNVTTLFIILLFAINACATMGETRVESNQGTVTINDPVVEQEGVLPGSFREGVRSLFIEYPDSCYEDGIEGMVEIIIDIRDTGEVIDARVERGIGGGCDESALETIRDSEFEPAMDAEGMPVVARHIVLVTFSQ